MCRDLSSRKWCTCCRNKLGQLVDQGPKVNTREEPRAKHVKMEPRWPLASARSSSACSSYFLLRFLLPTMLSLFARRVAAARGTPATILRAPFAALDARRTFLTAAAVAFPVKGTTAGATKAAPKKAATKAEPKKTATSKAAPKSVGAPKRKVAARKKPGPKPKKVVKKAVPPSAYCSYFNAGYSAPRCPLLRPRLPLLGVQCPFSIRVVS